MVDLRMVGRNAVGRRMVVPLREGDRRMVDLRQVRVRTAAHRDGRRGPLPSSSIPIRFGFGRCERVTTIP
jgi:hypothetical protein